MAEGTAGGNRGADTKGLNWGATEVTEWCVGQTQVCSSMCIAQSPPLPYLLSSSLCIFKAAAPQLVRNLLPLSLTLPFRIFWLEKVSLKFLCRTPQVPAPAG